MTWLNMTDILSVHSIEFMKKKMTLEMGYKGQIGLKWKGRESISVKGISIPRAASR